jgi:hypothetical protein
LRDHKILIDDGEKKVFVPFKNYSNALLLYLYYLEISGDKEKSWKSNRTISEELQISERTIEKLTKILSSPMNGLNGGSLITIQERYKSGSRERDSNLIILNDIMLLNISTISEEFKNKSNVAQTFRKVAQTLRGNNIPKNNNQRRAAKSCPDPDIPPDKMTTPFAAAAASLIKKGMGKEDVIMLEKIYKLRKAKVDAARNPPGLLLDLFAREDVRLEVLEEHEAAAAEQNKSARIVTDNTGVAKAVFEELLAADPEEQVYTIRLRDNNIQISFRGGGAETLCFYEKNFIKGLDRVRVGALQRVEAYNANL